MSTDSTVRSPNTWFSCWETTAPTSLQLSSAHSMSFEANHSLGGLSFKPHGPDAERQRAPEAANHKIRKFLEQVDPELLVRIGETRWSDDALHSTITAAPGLTATATRGPSPSSSERTPAGRHSTGSSQHHNTDASCSRTDPHTAR